MNHVPDGWDTDSNPAMRTKIPTSERWPVKRLARLILLGAGLLAGCSQHYVITLNNGTQLTSIGKPRLERGRYVFKNANGQTESLPRGRVREIAPQSMAKEEGGVFTPPISK
jgi:hypothetical protein